MTLRKFYKLSDILAYITYQNGIGKVEDMSLKCQHETNLNKLVLLVAGIDWHILTFIIKNIVHIVLSTYKARYFILQGISKKKIQLPLCLSAWLNLFIFFYFFLYLLSVIRNRNVIFHYLLVFFFIIYLF